MKKSANKITALYITPEGRKISNLLKKAYGNCLTVKAVKPGMLNRVFSEAFESDAVIAVMAAGIVVRAIAPLISDKRRDPAVTVVDEKGRYAVSLLSGHIGGANDLTSAVAAILGGQAVITTASDVNSLPALDVYARDRGYGISDAMLYKKTVMAMIRGERIGVFVEKGEPTEFFKNRCFRLFRNEKTFAACEGHKIAVSWRILPGGKMLRLVPRRLVLGMGFHRGMPAGDLLRFVAGIMKKHKLDIAATGKVATIERRRNEKGLIEFCAGIGASPVFFSESELNHVKAVARSKTVMTYVGTGSVAEAAAILASDKGMVLVPKEKGGVITACVALAKSM